MADGVFLLRGQLGGSEGVAEGSKYRVVSEAVAAPGLGDQGSLKHTFDHSLITVGSGHGRRAMKSCSSPIARNVRELRKEQLQVRRIVTV